MLGRLLTLVCSLSFLALPCVAQSDAPPATPDSSVPAASPSSPAPTAKKVWTNDDIPSAKSAAGNKRNQNSHVTPTTAPAADPATVDRIRRNLEKLQNQLDDVNKKLKSYKEFQEGEPVSTGARDLSKGISRTPVDQQMTQLQDKKKQLEGQISDLLDEARKKGIDPGQLR